MPKAWPTECLRDDIPTLKCLEAVFYNLLKVSVSLVTLALFVMLLVGGFKYLTSGGDPKATEAAKSTMTYAIIGLVVILASYLALRAIEYFTGVPLTRFEIPRY